MAVDFNIMAGKPFGLKYVDGMDVLEGDIVHFDWDVGYQLTGLVFWNAVDFSFKISVLNMKVASPLAISDEFDRKFYKLGSMYDSCDTLVKWKKAGEMEHSRMFLRQTDTWTCFPLAAINACIGAGISKSNFNFLLLRRCVDLGECRKWNGCVDEKAVLNEVSAELNVSFSQVDLQSVLETGGIVTLKDGGFHAVAAFVADGVTFLVNMCDGPFVRPCPEVLPRSAKTEHHRDYCLFFEKW
jgi:hypothetical protein